MSSIQQSIFLFLLALSLASAANRTSTCPDVKKCLERLDAGLQCQILPVPPSSTLPQLGPEGFRIDQLRKGVYAYYDGSHYAVILAAGRRFAFIDFPGDSSSKPDGSRTRLTDAAEMIIDDVRPVRFDMLYTHSHYDQIGGASLFFEYMKRRYSNTQIVIWATGKTREMIRLSESRRAPFPTNIIGPGRPVVKLSDDLEIQMSIVEGHTGGNVAMYIPKSNGMPSVLTYIDLVFPGWSPFLSLALAEDFREYEDAHRVLLKFNVDVFIGGHGVIGNKYSIRANFKFVKDLRKAAAAGIAAVTQNNLVENGIERVGDPSAREFGNLWYSFISVTRRLQIDNCYRIMLEKWGCKLAGLDITLRSHCEFAINFVDFEN